MALKGQGFDVRGGVNFAEMAAKICRCVPPPKKAVLSWLFAAPNVEGGRLKWGFS
jgi:hypothetical protein